MSEVLLEYPSSVFEILDEETKAQQSCFEFDSTSESDSSPTYNYTYNEELEAIAQLQKELSSPSSYNSHDDLSPVLPHNSSNLKISPDTPSRFFESYLSSSPPDDITMGDVGNQDVPSSPDSCRSPSPSPTNSGNLNPHQSHRVQTVQILKDLDIKVREDELANMKIGELSKIAGVRFTKNEEKEIKRLRRKIKNKLSAAQSRQKMKDYVSGLEERVESISQVNLQLKQRVQELEQENKILKQKLEASNSTDKKTSASNGSSLLLDTHAKHVAASSSNKKGNGVYLLMVLLSFGLFYGFSSFDFRSTQLQSIVSESASNSIVEHQKSFGRSILTSDLFMMDTKPLVDQSGSNGSNDESVWNSYINADLKFSNLDNDHDIIINGDPFCERENPQELSSSCMASPSPHASKIKSALESLAYVEKAYCGDTICVIRLDSQGFVI